MSAVLKGCIQDARILLSRLEDHGVDEVEEGSPESRQALLSAHGRDLAYLLRRLAGISTARLASLARTPHELPALRGCIQDARLLLAKLEDHGIDEVESGSPESREALLSAHGRDLAHLLRRLVVISTAHLTSLARLPDETPSCAPLPRQAPPHPAPPRESRASETAAGTVAEAAPAGVALAAPEADAGKQQSDDVRQKVLETSAHRAPGGGGDESRWGASPSRRGPELGPPPPAADGAQRPAARDAAPKATGASSPAASAAPRPALVPAPGPSTPWSPAASAAEGALPGPTAGTSLALGAGEPRPGRAAEGPRVPPGAAAAPREAAAPPEVDPPPERGGVRESPAAAPEPPGVRERPVAAPEPPRRAEARPPPEKRRRIALKKVHGGAAAAPAGAAASAAGEGADAELAGSEQRRAAAVAEGSSAGEGGKAAGGPAGAARAEGAQQAKSARGTADASRASETPAPKGRRLRSHDRQEGADDPERPTPEKTVAEPRPLIELLGPAPEADAMGPQDRQLLPRVVATFARWLWERKADSQKQTTRDDYVLTIFKLLSLSGRSFASIVTPAFLEAVEESEEACQNKALKPAIQIFRCFWDEFGGYGGAFDNADKDDLSSALNVKPALVDDSGECCIAMSRGRLCKRPNQRCVTCGTRLKCSFHCEHGVQECRDIFWIKHTPQGTRQQTIADIWKHQASGSGPNCPSHGPGNWSVSDQGVMCIDD